MGWRLLFSARSRFSIASLFSSAFLHLYCFLSSSLHRISISISRPTRQIKNPTENLDCLICMVIRADSTIQMASWSDLNIDALEHIMGFLSLLDHHCFSAVCQNWRWVAKNRHCSPAHQLPWLMMGEHVPTKKRKFYNLSEGRRYYIDIPELQGQYWIGSSYGWLFLINKKFVPRLFNPFTKEMYEPPLLPAFKKKMFRGESRKAVLSHDPSKTRDFAVLFIYGTIDPNLAFWRHGDSTWKCISCKQDISDAVFFKGNFYVAFLCQLVVIPHLQPNPTLKPVMPLLQDSGIRYLVEFMGELVLVERRLKNIADRYDCHFVTSRFVAYKLNLEKGCLTPCKDFGDYTIFLGASCSVVVNSQQFRGCKKNSIYFTDMALKACAEGQGRDDLGVYDFTRDTTEPYYPPEVFHPFHEPPIWLTPNVNLSL